MLKMQKTKTQKQKKNRTTNIKENRKYTHANNIYTYIHRFVDGIKFWQVFFPLYLKTQVWFPVYQLLILNKQATSVKTE